VAQLGARLDGIEEVTGSNPVGSTNEFSDTKDQRKDLFVITARP
jgi:hypothetical protein